MTNIKETVLKKFNQIFHKKTLLYGLMIISLIVISLTNSVHEKYPDEFDNLLGGRYLTQGKIIYKDFFTHHGPFPYFLASTILPFTGLSFVNFRLMYGLLIVVYFLAIARYIKSRDKESGNLFIIFIPIWLVASVYFWGHMLLADNISALAFIPVYAIIAKTIFFNKTFRYRDLIITSILLSTVQLSSLSYTFLNIITYAFIVLLTITSHKSKKFTLSSLLILAIPYIIFFCFLLLTNSIKDYYIQNFQFNSQYYIYNYPRPEGSTTINPIRYSIIIIHNYIKNTHPLLTNF
jgi:hypothetical protein